MTLRPLLFVALVGACGRTRAPETIAGPQLGESTASGPSDPNLPPPDATGATEVHAALSVPPGPAPAPRPNGGQAAPNASGSAEVTPPAPIPPASDAGVQPNVFSPPPDGGAAQASPPATQPASPPAMR